MFLLKQSADRNSPREHLKVTSREAILHLRFGIRCFVAKILVYSSMKNKNPSKTDNSMQKHLTNLLGCAKWFHNGGLKICIMANHMIRKIVFLWLLEEHWGTYLEIHAVAIHYWACSLWNVGLVIMKNGRQHVSSVRSFVNRSHHHLVYPSLSRWRRQCFLEAELHLWMVVDRAQVNVFQLFDPCGAFWTFAQVKFNQILVFDVKPIWQQQCDLRDSSECDQMVWIKSSPTFSKIAQSDFTEKVTFFLLKPFWVLMRL